MSLSSAKAKLDAQGGDPVTGYISKTDHQESYDELVDDTALTGATTAEAITVSGALVAGTVNGRDPDDLVAGPASATDNALVRFDGTGGKTVQNSGITVDDSNNVSGVGTIGSGAVTSSGAVQAAAASGFVVGSSGPRVMSGTGSPEGVVTAPVGSTWIDTNATTGAIKWIKASGTGNTGWIVSEGDTGTRNIASLMTANATATVGALRIRRVGPMVSLMVRLANSVTATSHEVFASLPSGFLPGVVLGAYAVRDVASYTSAGHFFVEHTGRSYFSTPDGNYRHCTLTWPTTDAWPSSLPGSAA